MNRSDILDTREDIKGLCKLARELGYKDPFAQLINSDGTCVGDLLCFLEDNPGACEALIAWAAEHHGEEEEEEEEEEP